VVVKKKDGEVILESPRTGRQIYFSKDRADIQDSSRGKTPDNLAHETGYGSKDAVKSAWTNQNREYLLSPPKIIKTEIPPKPYFGSPGNLSSSGRAKVESTLINNKTDQNQKETENITFCRVRVSASPEKN
jgi:hypothetical protein